MNGKVLQRLADRARGMLGAGPPPVQAPPKRRPRAGHRGRASGRTCGGRYSSPGLGRVRAAVRTRGLGRESPEDRRLYAVLRSGATRDTARARDGHAGQPCRDRGARRAPGSLSIDTGTAEGAWCATRRIPSAIRHRRPGPGRIADLVRRRRHGRRDRRTRCLTGPIRGGTLKSATPGERGKPSGSAISRTSRPATGTQSPRYWLTTSLLTIAGG